MYGLRTTILILNMIYVSKIGLLLNRFFDDVENGGLLI
ncbi:hypothetical protein L580_4182 [Serratia fonticola AU-P3(3)]|nr:hypothetical protein L580_4182 [Serratia fonticola AU-P3(3)]